MAGSINEILSTRVTTRAVSRVAAASSRLLTFFGMGPGGPNTEEVPQREYGIDIYNDTREVAPVVAPDKQLPIMTRNPVGRFNVVIQRAGGQLPMTLDKLHNQRPIGGQASEIDSIGSSYIARQQTTMGQKLANFRLGLVGGMVRGNAYVHRYSGSDLSYIDYTSSGAYIAIDWQIPAGNKTQCDMLGAGNIITASWANPNTNIPEHVMQMNAAMQQLTGSMIEVGIINSGMWKNLVNNYFIIQQAGSAASPFTVLAREEGVAQNGLRWTTFRARLAAIPWMEWIITDEGMQMGVPTSLTYTKFIPDNKAWFGPDPEKAQMTQFFSMAEGPEPVIEYPNGPATVRYGLHAWTYRDGNPAKVSLFAQDNAMAQLIVPSATIFATPVF